MTRRMLIDATHPEETRVTVVDGHRLEEFDYETTTKKQLKGNIYLAKVTRVEPSLQAAFVEYGGNRHGFLAFSEIHPDYYRIPVADREDLVDESPDANGDDDDDGGPEEDENGEPVEDMGGDEAVDEAVERSAKRRPRLRRHYKIQEVIKRRQVMLVQVVKEERGNKGAAMTTYLSLAGRYCVVMPNTSRGGGVSRKISNPADRKRLKSVLTDLDVPSGMAVILRTAGAERSKAEIKRDFEYITKLWDDIRNTTLASTAPALIHEEGNLIKRSIRDLYSKDIEEIQVAGEEAYRTAKDFMRALIPSHAKKVQPYKDEQGTPLFQRYQVEHQLAQIHEPTVQLRSGGSIVLHQTEALVSIDVNSGKATRERHIEETALKTNLEAAEEVARQLRLRDMAGLVVIDFIDMEENRNAHAVERKLKEALRRDRARIQVGRISAFGLLEMSRQRLRPSLIETMSQPCPTCGGVGYIVSTETAALIVLRAIEEEALRRRASIIKVTVPGSVALYLLNNKRDRISEVEDQYDLDVAIEVADGMLPPHYEMERTTAEGTVLADEPEESDQRRDRGRGRARGGSGAGSGGGSGRRRDRQDPRRGREPEEAATDRDADTADEEPAREDEAREGGSRRRRSRGRRRRYEEEAAPAREDAGAAEEPDTDAEEAEGSDASEDRGNGEDDGGARRRRKRGRRGGRRRGRGRGEDDAGRSEQDDGSVSAGDDGDGGDGNSPSIDPSDSEQPDLAPDDTDPTSAAAADAVAEAPDSADGDVGSDKSDLAGDAAEEDAAPKSRRKASAKKGRAKKTSAKKATAKKGRAKKAASRKAEPAEVSAEDPPAEEHGASDQAEPAGDAAQAPKAEPVADGTPAPGTEDRFRLVAANNGAPDPVDPPRPAALDVKTEADPDKPKRKGWWSRVVGS